MSHLPPATWNEVTTKADLDALPDRRGNQLRAEFIDAENRQNKWLAAFAATCTTALITAVRLIA